MLEVLMNAWDMLPAILEGVLMVVGGCAIIAKYTPTPKDDLLIAKIYGMLDWLAQNTNKKD